MTDTLCVTACWPDLMGKGWLAQLGEQLVYTE